MKVIITGVTGMVGEGVLHECIQHPEIETVLVIGRKPYGIKNDRVKEILVSDLSDLSSAENELRGYDACFFCAGVSSIGMKEEDYFRITYTMTIKFAEVLSRLNPGMVFEYISGSGTDSTEKGKLMWARVKGKTENDLLEMPFRAVYNFRPGFLRPTKGLKNTLKYYRYVNWFFPVLNAVTPGLAGTLTELGRAMINAALYGYEKSTIEVRDIKTLAKKI